MASITVPFEHGRAVGPRDVAERFDRRRASRSWGSPCRRSPARSGGTFATSSEVGIEVWGLVLASSGPSLRRSRMPGPVKGPTNWPVASEEPAASSLRARGFSTATSRRHRPLRSGSGGHRGRLRRLPRRGGPRCDPSRGRGTWRTTVHRTRPGPLGCTGWASPSGTPFELADASGRKWGPSREPAGPTGDTCIVRPAAIAWTGGRNPTLGTSGPPVSTRPVTPPAPVRCGRCAARRARPLVWPRRRRR